MKTFKIAFIVNAFPKLSETFILNQITGLLDLGHDVEIFVRFNPEEKKVHPDVEKYHLMERVHYISDIPHNKIKRTLKAAYLICLNFHKGPIKIFKSLNIFRYGRSALSLTWLYNLIPFLDTNFDMIHCHFGLNGSYAVFLKDMGAISGKILTAFHGYDITKVTKNNKRAYEYLFKKGDGFLPISNYFENRLIELGCDRNKIIVHRMGVDVERFKFRKRKLFPGEKIKMLSVARLVEKKGIEYAVKAVAEIVSAFPDIEYNIIGDGPLNDSLRKLIRKLNLEEKIRMLGWKEQVEVVKLMHESHIFLAPSVTASSGDQEGIPVVLMEAMAQGLPVISTYHSGIPELIEDGISGFLLPEKNVATLAERLAYLIDHPENWPEMGYYGRQVVEKHFNIQKLNKRLVSIYQSLIEEI